MFVFKDMDEIELTFNCKVCFKEEKIKISKADFMNIKEFPAIKEFVHENPPHKLKLYINKNLEIENFKVEDILETEVNYSEDLVRQALSEIELTHEEIELYFLSTGRDVISLGEIAILIGKPKEECLKIAKKFVEKGLFKEIVGASPHFSPLPPYAALVSQLQSFHGFISEIHSHAPKELEESFKEMESKTEGMGRLKDYTNFMKNLKTNTIDTIARQKEDMDATIAGVEKIKDLTATISGLDEQTKALFEQHSSTLSEQFDVINTKVSEAIKKQFLELIEEIMSVKSKISTNLQKLRLGVIQQTVDQVIDNVFTTWIKQISDSLNAQVADIKDVTEGVLKDSIQEFFNDLISNLKNIIDSSLTNIDKLLETTSRAGSELKVLFEDVNQKFSKAVELSEEKLEGITDSIFESFGTLKNTFSNQIISTLNQVLGEILKRLEISEITTKEFWDQAKKVSTFTMKDIWFIRSVEGAKAHISEVVKKVKSKILIVAPEITDVDIESLKACKKHVNIRIAALVDLSLPDHVSAYQELSEISNITVRNRVIQNIWGINRDYEEVILCVISKTLIGTKVETEIAGIGSMISEHIKIFVPNLEDAWLNAHKDVLSSTKHAIARGVVRKRLVEKQQVISSPSPASSSQPVPTPRPVSTPHPTSTPRSVSTPHPTSVEAPGTTSGAPIFQETAIAALNGDDRLSYMFDRIIENLKNVTGAEVISALSQLHGDITEIRGYSAILKQIELGINSIQTRDKLKKAEADALAKKIKFWRKKLNL
ncbi:MAG: hypothetical protein ACFFAS_15130 [Promethearchaeota archaeon]